MVIEDVYYDTKYRWMRKIFTAINLHDR